MKSKEIIKARRVLQKELREVVNFQTGLYTKEKKEWDEKVKDLQASCPHNWDNGEIAIAKLGEGQVCSICGKKWR